MCLFDENKGHGTCLVEVVEGLINHSEKNEREQLINLKENYRLTYQCQKQKDIVKIPYKNYSK